MKRNILAFIVALLAATLIYLFFAPVPIAPAAWTPPANPGLAGPYEQNSRLTPVQRLSLGEGHAPEDVAVDGDGKIYGGFEDGRIVQLAPDGTQPHVFANTQGRPLGLVFGFRLFRDRANLVIDLRGFIITGRQQKSPQGVLNYYQNFLSHSPSAAAGFGSQNDFL